MRSKSSKRKLRKNHELHEFIKRIRVELIDARNGLRFYLVSVLSEDGNKAQHHEVHGYGNAISKYRELVDWKRTQLFRQKLVGFAAVVELTAKRFIGI